MKKAFALIYALLLTTILLFVVGGVAIALVSGIKLTRQSRVGVQAYSLARSGMSDAWTKYQASAKQLPEFPIPSPNPTSPNGGCDGYYRVYYLDGGVYKEDPIATNDLNTWMNGHPSASKDGFYAYRICGEASKVAFSIGFFNGQKVSLKAIITPFNTNPSLMPQLIKFTYDYTDPSCVPASCPPTNPNCCITSGLTSMCKNNGYPIPPAPTGTENCSDSDEYNNGDNVTITETRYSHMFDRIKIFQTNL